MSNNFAKQSILEIVKTLIAFRSITPDDDGCLDFIQLFLAKLGFRCQILAFEGTRNLYARIGEEGNNFCYLGHIDVVPPGDLSLWNASPFEAHVVDGRVYGRGVCDMKGSVAAFMFALQQFFVAHRADRHSLSVLLTSNEEGDRKGGTQMALASLAQQGEKIDCCLIGEPTSRAKIGDYIKRGRRGSVNLTVHVLGKQGHVAYPHLADNPVTKLCNLLVAMKASIDTRGTALFPQPSNLEVISLLVDNRTFNIIPSRAGAMLNIRFNDLYTISTLVDLLRDICRKYVGSDEFIIEQHSSSEYCLASNNHMSDIARSVVKEISGHEAELSTEGGVSDACYLAQHCNNWVELGLQNSTAHQINENVVLDDIVTLSAYYLGIIKAMT